MRDLVGERRRTQIRSFRRFPDLRELLTYACYLVFSRPVESSQCVIMATELFCEDVLSIPYDVQGRQNHVEDLGGGHW